jgi:uncharacterized protein (DUF1501 family)
MSLTRRAFLHRSALALPAALVASNAFARGVFAAPGLTRNLILVELFGGNDGLNTLPPWGFDPYYTEFRPTIAVPEAQVLKVAGQPVGFHPAMAALKSHFDAGRLAVIQGVSYPDPSFSHDYAQRVWHTGSLDNSPEGWLARYLNLLPTPAFPNVAEILGSPSLLTAGADGFVPAFTSVGDMVFPSDNWYPHDTAARKLAYSSIAAAAAAGTLPLNAVARTSSGLVSLIDTFEQVPEIPFVGQYPDERFSELLQQIVRLLNANLGMRCFHVGMGGFDTHSRQNEQDFHAQLLQTVSDALGAFYTDLAALGLAQDTLIVVFSEFGRTVYQNGSAGTDHGTVNPVLVLGGSGVVGGFANDHPPVDPSQLDPDFDELARQADYRDVFGTILRRWLGVSQAEADAVFPGHSVADLGFLA